MALHKALDYISISRAVSVRAMFASHGIISVWRLYHVTKEPIYWYLSGTLGLLLIESMVTVLKRKGKEWKWFCPSVFIYLLTSVPAIWFLELHEVDRRIRQHAKLLLYARTFNLTVVPTDLPQVQEDLSAPVGSVLGVRFEVRIPIKLTADQWIRMLEQLLLLILILGRWLLPKGKLSHDQLSQLLLVYIGTAADIVEFFEAFKEKEVRYHKVLSIIILSIWSLSLLQFSLVITAARVRLDHTRVYTKQTGCCHADVFGIVITIVLQDLPFLVLRMLLIFRYNVLSYTNMFFTSKNTLVIVLLVYRLVVLFMEKRRYDKKTKMEYTSDESSEFEDVSENSVFRQTATLQRKLVKLYQSDYLDNGYCTLPKQHYLKVERHDWENTYCIEDERKYDR